MSWLRKTFQSYDFGKSLNCTEWKYNTYNFALGKIIKMVTTVQLKKVQVEKVYLGGGVMDVRHRSDPGGDDDVDDVVDNDVEEMKGGEA